MLIEVRSRRGRCLGLGLWPGGLCLETAGGVYVEFLWRDNRPIVTCLTTQNSERKIRQIGQKYRQNSCSRIMRIGLDQTVTGKTLLQRQTAGGRK